MTSFATVTTVAEDRHAMPRRVGREWTFRLCGEDVTLTTVDSAVAVRTTEQARSRAGSRQQLVRKFGGTALDTAHGGKYGLDLPSQDRQLFERAGWLFVEPKPDVARAAAITRASVDEAETVRQVFVDRWGNMRISTDLLSLQLAADSELPSSDVQGLIDKDGLQLVQRLAFAPNTFEVRAAGQRPLMELVQALQENSSYRFAEPVLLQAISGRWKPDGIYYGSQWQHANDGSNGGSRGADIRSEQAWDVTRGRSSDRPVRIAVIDNGMHVRHPGLRKGIVGGGCFQSDEMGGSVFVPFDPSMKGFPKGNHGTFCMGMAAARASKDGGSGSAPEADLLAYACFADQVGNQVTLAKAIGHATGFRPGQEIPTGDGADVISCSLGPSNAPYFDLGDTLDEAIRSAANKGRGGRGIPIFWAVSNGSFPIAGDEVCSHPDVIAVGRSNRHDLADGSAYGPELEFLAPGVEVFSTLSGNKYGPGTGTSYAAPLAAGVAALVLARHPEWTAQQVRERLRQTCDKTSSVDYTAEGRHDKYGFGRINAAQAVR